MAASAKRSRVTEALSSEAKSDDAASNAVLRLASNRSLPQSLELMSLAWLPMKDMFAA
jgi:hypothetical protein